VLAVVTKDGRVLRFLLHESRAEQIFNLMNEYAFPRDIERHLFCFAHRPAQAGPNGFNGWGVYDCHVRTPWLFHGLRGGRSGLGLYGRGVVLDGSMERNGMGLCNRRGIY
jgi:hypothetical protein